MQQFKVRTSERPRLMPSGRWVMTQRWNDLLFAHWRMRPAQVMGLLPEGLVADTFEGSAWLGVVPFWMDRIKVRGLPSIFGARSFPEINLRTYVRDLRTGTPGVYFFSLDGANLLAVLAARTFYHLPSYWASTRLESRGEREFSFSSNRRLSAQPVRFDAQYRGLGPTRRLAESRAGTLEHFLTERSCLFTRNGAGKLMRTSVQHVSWQLEDARADIVRNDLPASMGIVLEAQQPVLHYSRRLALYMWTPELAIPAQRSQRIPAQALPSA